MALLDNLALDNLLPCLLSHHLALDDLTALSDLHHMTRLDHLALLDDNLSHA